LASVGNVVIRQERRHVDGDLGVELAADGLSAQLGHGFFQDARIGVKADGREQARLAIAQDLARAADFEIVRGHLKPGA
jgi:hypothetical protein